MYFQLIHFKTVVDAGSINRASHILHLSQPALSKSVKTLEQYFQIRLLERGPSGVRPTGAGNMVYQTALAMEQQMRQVSSDLNHHKLSRAGISDKKDIRLGCSTIWVDILLPEIIKRFGGAGYAAVHMIQGTSETLLEDMAENSEYDLVLIRMVHQDRYRQIRMEPLFQSQAAVFAHDSHILHTGGASADTIAKSRWIKLKSLPFPEDHELTPEAHDLFPPGFFPPPVSFETGDLMSAVQFLENGYIILLPLDFKRILKRYAVRPLPFARGLTQPYWCGIAHPAEQDLPLCLQALIADIRLFFAR